MQRYTCLGATLLLLLPADAVRAPIGRRAVLGGAAAACAACANVKPAAAGLKADLAEGENALGAASSVDGITAALEKLQVIVEDFGGLPTQELTEQLVVAMRAKRSALQGAGSSAWNGITEEAYNRLMRQVDPWRVTELRGPFQNAIFTFPIA